MQIRCPLLYFCCDGAAIPDYVTRDEFPPPTKASAKGPEGLIGRLQTPCKTVYDLLYEPDRQKWIEQPAPNGRGRFWIGVDSEAKLVSGEVIRDSIMQGHPVKMLNQLWQIPVARIARGGTGLPQRRVLQKDGSRVWRVEEAYEELCQFADRWWRAHVDGGSDIQDAEADVAVGLALAVNYRIGMREAAALEMLDINSIGAILDALIDGPEVRKLLNVEKKTLAV